ncbi:hypothetical protein ACQUJS_05760 [Ralstonia pseudosolanacearum]
MQQISLPQCRGVATSSCVGGFWGSLFVGERALSRVASLRSGRLCAAVPRTRSCDCLADQDVVAAGDRVLLLPVAMMAGSRSARSALILDSVSTVFPDVAVVRGAGR